MEFATISTIDLQRLEKALTPLGGSFRYSAIYKNFIQTEGKKIMPAFKLISEEV